MSRFKKCIRWIEEYLREGGTLLLVSHSIYHVQKLCKHALWIKDGRVHAFGDVFAVTQDYLAYHERISRVEGETGSPKGSASDYRVVEVHVDDSENERIVVEKSSVRCVIKLKSPDDREPRVGWGVLRADGTAVYGSVSDMEDARANRVGDQFEHVLNVDLSSLLPGQYTLRFHAMDPEGLRVFDTVERSLILRGASRDLGLVRLPHRWNKDL